MASEIASENSRISSMLWGKIPEDQKRAAMSCTASAEIDEEFLGFVAIYDRLSKIIPHHFTVIDFGCSYAPQSFLFERHSRYIGVDISSDFRFFADNTTHFVSPIIDFIDMGHDFGKSVFAICSYVPDWHGKNREKVRNTFDNVFTFYPSGCP